MAPQQTNSVSFDRKSAIEEIITLGKLTGAEAEALRTKLSKSNATRIQAALAKAQKSGQDAPETKPVTPGKPEAKPAESKKEEPAKEAKAEEPASAYALEGTDRVELLTKAQVLARNSHARSDNKKWVPATAEQAKTAVKPNDIPVGKEREEKQEQGRAKDRQFDAALKAKKAEQEKAAKDEKDGQGTGEGAKKSDKSASKTGTNGGLARKQWNGIGMCDMIRYCGKKGWDKKVTAFVMEKIGFTPSGSTINIQHKRGVKGEDVPSVTKDQAEELKGYAEKAPKAAKANSKK